MADHLHLLDALDAWVGARSHGRLHRIAVLRSDSQTPYEVEITLRRFGIRIWGRDPGDPNEFSFFVRYRQAKWAEYVICRAGLQILTPLLDPRNRTYRTRHAANSMPKPWHPKGIGAISLVDHVVDWLARLQR